MLLYQLQLLLDLLFSLGGLLELPSEPVAPLVGLRQLLQPLLIIKNSCC